jgi:hypothetical protein
MKISIATAFTAILFAQSASAWTFTWRDSSGTAHVHDGGSDNMGCAQIAQAQGQQFDWARGWFSSCCISLYSNNGCVGDPQGYSCDDWSKTASLNLYSYQVTNC